MDYKNLAYLQAAKRLNARQVRWALFFTCFSLVITYRPGSRNTEPDVLSRQFSLVEDAEEKDKPILPASCIIGTVTWEIERLVINALQQDPEPGSGQAVRPCGCSGQGDPLGTYGKVLLPSGSESHT